MTGEAEIWYGTITVGLSVPVFVHYAKKYIVAGLPEARRTLHGMRTAAHADFERTKKILRGEAELEEIDSEEEREEHA